MWFANCERVRNKPSITAQRLKDKPKDNESHKTKYMKYNFEDYLKDKHMERYQGTDDDSPDAYEHWLSNMDMDLLIAFGDAYGAKKALMAVEELGKKLRL
jgi:hypothetical protein